MTPVPRTPYLFTSKELDEETGLYYFEARYYDPRTSVWQSADQILGSYLGGQPNGGVFHSPNLSLYSYTWQNPLIYRDPNGQEVTQDAVISFSRLIHNVRTWENQTFGAQNIPATERLSAFRDQIKGNDRFGSSGSFTQQKLYGTADTSVLGWHYIHTKEGWIDFGHFAEAAIWSDRVGEFATKAGGSAIEFGQFAAAHIPGYSTATKTSAYTREDFRSNRLGAEFATYLETYEGNSLTDALESFLLLYSPSENPRNAADFSSFPASQDVLDSGGYLSNLKNAWGNMLENRSSGVGTLYERSNPEE